MDMTTSACCTILGTQNVIDVRVCACVCARARVCPKACVFVEVYGSPQIKKKGCIFA